MSNNSIKIPRSKQGKTPSPLDLNDLSNSNTNDLITTPFDLDIHDLNDLNIHDLIATPLDLNNSTPSIGTAIHYNEYGSYDPDQVCATIQARPDEQAKKKWAGYNLVETSDEHNERIKQLRCDYDAEDDILFKEQLDELLKDDLDSEMTELFDAVKMKEMLEEEAAAEATEMFEDAEIFEDAAEIFEDATEATEYE